MYEIFISNGNVKKKKKEVTRFHCNRALHFNDFDVSKTKFKFYILNTRVYISLNCEYSIIVFNILT